MNPRLATQFERGGERGPAATAARAGLMNPRLATEYERGDVRGPSLRGLVGEEAARLDVEGVRRAFGEAPADGTTCIAGVRWSWVAEVADGMTCVEGARWAEVAGVEDIAEVAGVARVAGVAEVVEDAKRSLAEALVGACGRAPVGRVALALSGGVDSAVLAGLLRGRVAVYTLESGLPGYCEAGVAQAVADSLGVGLRRVRVAERDYVDCLPAAIRGCETPLYNLHPVSRYLLARAVRADGFEVLISGDGADEVFAGRDGADYLPVVGALTRAAGLVAWAPFLDAAVVGFRGDPDKRRLRALAKGLGVPERVAAGPKRGCYAPAMDLSRYLDRGIEEVGRMLGREVRLASDRERVGWATLGLFVEHFPGLERCAG